MALKTKSFCNFLLAFLKRFLNNSHYQPAARTDTAAGNLLFHYKLTSEA
jgi:hypothetical protein